MVGATDGEKQKGNAMIDLTKEQCENMVDLIENCIFDVIRNDTEIDNIQWLVNIVDSYKEMKKGMEQCNG